MSEYQVTQEQLDTLEKVHGSVIPLSVGDADFVFRRPSDLNVDIALEAKGRGDLNFHEEMAVCCLLCPEAPEMGISVEQNTARPKDEQDALKETKLRLRALWQRAPFLRDWLSLTFAEHCGWGAVYESAPVGPGLYRVTARARPDGIPAEDFPPIVINARVFSREEYSEYRRRSQLEPEGSAERYAWRVLVDAPNKAELARQYPYLVVGIGKSVLPTLGSEGIKVGKKKFAGGPPNSPGESMTVLSTET